MIFWKLFADFFRVSCFTFGGAYGAIPLIREMVMGNGWIEEERLAYMIAVSESTPGPIIVNLATYIGNDQAGFWGSLVATVGVVLPAYLVILLVMVVMKHALKDPKVQAVLRGLKPCVIGIVLATGIYMTAANCFGTISSPGFNLQGVIVTAILAGSIFAYRHFRKKKLSDNVR